MKPTSSRRFKRKIAEVVALCALILSIIAFDSHKSAFSAEDSVIPWYEAGYKISACSGFPISGMAVNTCFSAGPFWRVSPLAGFEYKQWAAYSGADKYFVYTTVRAGLTKKSLNPGIELLKEVPGRASHVACPFPDKIWNLAGTENPLGKACLLEFTIKQITGAVEGNLKSGGRLTGQTFNIDSEKYDRAAYFYFVEFPRVDPGYRNGNQTGFGVVGTLYLFYKSSDKISTQNLDAMLSTMDFDMASVPH